VYLNCYIILKFAYQYLEVAYSNQLRGNPTSFGVSVHLSRWLIAHLELFTYLSTDVVKPTSVITSPALVMLSSAALSFILAE